MGVALLRSREFDAWLSHLRDPIGRARILARIRSAEAGNFGDVVSVGGGVSEMRVHVGPGYRIYFARRGNAVFLLLCGGSKSGQKRDINKAIRILESYEDRHE